MAANAAFCNNGESEWRTGKPMTPATAGGRSRPRGHWTGTGRYLGELAHELPRFWSSHDCRSTVAATASIPTRRARQAVLGEPVEPVEPASGLALRHRLRPDPEANGGGGRLRPSSSVHRARQPEHRAPFRELRPPRQLPMQRGPYLPPESAGARRQLGRRRTPIRGRQSRGGPRSCHRFS